MVSRRLALYFGAILGWVLTVAGAAMAYVPAGLVVAGVSLVVLCLFVLDDGTPTRGGVR